MTDRLMSLLAEQLDFLSVSCERFDAGHLHEAKRIAHALRVLLHDTGKSTSLLHQLGWKQELKFLDTRRIPIAPPGKRVLSAVGVPFGMVHVHIGGGYYPSLGRGSEEPEKWIPFEEWWTVRVIADKGEGNTWARKDFVLDMTHQEGGSHVDPNPSPSWASLRDETFRGAGRFSSERHVYLVQAVVRQIAFEVTETLKPKSVGEE